MSEVHTSRRAVICALATIPTAIAIPAIASAASIPLSQSTWREAAISYRAAKIAWHAACDNWAAACEGATPFPKPAPVEPLGGRSIPYSLDMTLREIRDAPIDTTVWDAYERDMQVWHKDSRQWEQEQTGEADRQWTAALASLRVAIRAVAACNVADLVEAAEKAELGAEIFGRGEDSDGEPEDLVMFFATMANDMRRLSVGG